MRRELKLPPLETAAVSIAILINESNVFDYERMQEKDWKMVQKLYFEKINGTLSLFQSQGRCCANCLFDIIYTMDPKGFNSEKSRSIDSAIAWAIKFLKQHKFNHQTFSSVIEKQWWITHKHQGWENMT